MFLFLPLTLVNCKFLKLSFRVLSVGMSEDTDVEDAVAALRRALSEPSEGNVVNLLEALLPFAPPGLEWGIEFSYLAGITYMLEDGKVLAVRVSRDEFGPFMQTSVASVGLEAVPSQALKQVVDDVGGFAHRVAKHLRSWLERAPPNHPKRGRVAKLLEALEKEGVA